MATQKEWLVQGMENDTIFVDADFDHKAQAKLLADAVKEERPQAIVAIYRLQEEL